MPWTIPAIIISYLVGSIPTAYIFGRLLKGTDIRGFGSGNVGATNALRLLGKGWGVTVLVLDIGKGLLPVVFLPGVFAAKSGISAETLAMLVGLGCICGHIWTVFLNFRGGKGVATTFGVLIGLSIMIAGLKIVLGLAVAVWLLVFAFSRIISLASILAALSFPLLALLFRQPPALIGISSLLATFIVYRHKSNIQRILSGNESRLSFKK